MSNIAIMNKIYDVISEIRLRCLTDQVKMSHKQQQQAKHAQHSKHVVQQLSFDFWLYPPP
jgi:hypothetical protein